MTTTRPVVCQHPLHRLGKALVHPGRQALQGSGFDVKGLARQARRRACHGRI
jgi:hypothetical protein